MPPTNIDVFTEMDSYFSKLPLY
jgi:hypothetical protein